ncbi:MAG: hypothetical protein KDA81_06810, partial [Planctomycetaceae bacterium]|nr:hypothetical protein [Planctomycetaceae bacterium]
SLSPWSINLPFTVAAIDVAPETGELPLMLAALELPLTSSAPLQSPAVQQSDASGNSSERSSQAIVVSSDQSAGKSAARTVNREPVDAEVDSPLIDAVMSHPQEVAAILEHHGSGPEAVSDVGFHRSGAQRLEITQ